MDTLAIKTVKDSTIKGQTYIERTITIEKSTETKTDYCLKTLDFISSISWPLTILIIVLVLKKHIIILLNIISTKIKDSKTFTISKDGITVATGTTTDISFDKLKSQENVNTFGYDPLTDSQSKRILSTLWIHQQEYDKNYNTRWTFTLGTSSPDFLEFSQSAQRLERFGLITYVQSNGQFCLTDSGIKFCETNKDRLGDFSYFKA